METKFRVFFCKFLFKEVESSKPYNEVNNIAEKQIVLE